MPKKRNTKLQPSNKYLKNFIHNECINVYRFAKNSQISRTSLVSWVRNEDHIFDTENQMKLDAYMQKLKMGINKYFRLKKVNMESDHDK